MATPAKKNATYDDLYRIPDTMIGEIIDGELHAMPRPSPKHAKVASDLGAVVTYAYRFGRGGPGGWIILDEPELQFDTVGAEPFQEIEIDLADLWLD
jgi:Uma2 family endonuclease